MIMKDDISSININYYIILEGILDMYVHPVILDGVHFIVSHKIFILIYIEKRTRLISMLIYA